MKFIDMFCGMGTVRMGFEQAGHECVYSIEWDKHKRKIYEVIFGHEPEGSDIRQVRASELPNADCWCFGAPCQDFSIAGTRSGLEGDRSSLVREVFRLVRETPEEYRPEWLLYENVKGMLSSNKGLDYLEILFEMESLGYDIEWQMLDSKRHGVPQSRERVFTIGHLRERSARKVFPIGRTDQPVGVPIKRVAHANNFRRYWQTYDLHSSTEALDTCQGGGRQPCVMVNGRIRKITPREFWRLQGVSDKITDKVIKAGISDSQMYKAAGDACTVNVIYEIASRMSTER
jgi:DNA-cytosine methyltransferase